MMTEIEAALNSLAILMTPDEFTEFVASQPSLQEVREKLAQKRETSPSNLLLRRWVPKRWVTDKLPTEERNYKEYKEVE